MFCSKNCFSWLMYGHVVWLFMSCWLELILLKIKMTLGILGKQFRYNTITFNTDSDTHSCYILIIFSLSYPYFLSSCAANNGCSIQDPWLCSHISRLQTPPFSYICSKSIKGMLKFSSNLRFLPTFQFGQTIVCVYIIYAPFVSLLYSWITLMLFCWLCNSLLIICYPLV